VVDLELLGNFALLTALAAQAPVAVPAKVPVAMADVTLPDGEMAAFIFTVPVFP
jgi:hypothetical protein